MTTKIQKLLHLDPEVKIVFDVLSEISGTSANKLMNKVLEDWSGEQTAKNPKLFEMIYAQREQREQFKKSIGVNV